MPKGTAALLLSLIVSGIANAGERLTDSEVIAKIKTGDHVLQSSFSGCIEEHLVRAKEKNRERFTYSAKCSLKEAEDACERHQVTAKGTIEDWMVTVYDLKLHLLCLD